MSESNEKSEDKFGKEEVISVFDNFAKALSATNLENFVRKGKKTSELWFMAKWSYEL